MSDKNKEKVTGIKKVEVNTKVDGINKQTSSSTEEQLLIEKLKKQIKYMGELIEDCAEEVENNARSKNL